MKDNRPFDGARSHHDHQAGSFTSLNPLINEAKRSKLWLYNKFNNAWYTPEEFTAKYGSDKYNNYDIMRMLENIVIRDPRAGIRAYHKQLQKTLAQLEQVTKDLREKGEAFEIRVVDYYLNNKSDKA